MDLVLSNPTKSTPEIIKEVMEMYKNGPLYVTALIRGYVRQLEILIQRLTKIKDFSLTEGIYGGYNTAEKTALVAKVLEDLQTIDIDDDDDDDDDDEVIDLTPAAGGSKTVDETKQMLQGSYDKKDTHKTINGKWVLDEELSNKWGKVYVNEDSKEISVVHRGTTSAKDWLNNANYAIGTYKMTDRYKTGKKLQESALKKYKGYEVDTLGHSQGAILARDLGKDSKNVITVNPAYLGESQAKNDTSVRSSGDVVSAAKVPMNALQSILNPKKTKKKNVTVNTGSWNPLTNHSVDATLDQLDPNKVIGGFKIPKKYKVDANMLKKYP